MLNAQALFLTGSWSYGTSGRIGHPWALSAGDNVRPRRCAWNRTLTLAGNECTDLTQDERTAAYAGLKLASLRSDLPRLRTHKRSGALLTSMDLMKHRVECDGLRGCCWKIHQQCFLRFIMRRNGLLLRMEKERQVAVSKTWYIVIPETA